MQRSISGGSMCLGSNGALCDTDELQLKLEELARENSLLQQQLQQQGEVELKKRIKVR